MLNGTDSRDTFNYAQFHFHRLKHNIRTCQRSSIAIELRIPTSPKNITLTQKLNTN